MNAWLRWMPKLPLRSSSSKVARRPEVPRPRDGPELLSPEEVVFLICVEANRLEPQALLLCASIRRFGGRYRGVPIVAVSPRQHLWLSPSSRAQLEALDVTYVALPLNTSGSSYGSINRIVVGAWAEAELSHRYLVVLDTDTVVLSEPDFIRADVGVRPVDVKGSATTGADDRLDDYWAQLCRAAGIDLQRLPMLHTTIDGQRIRASYNGGFTVVRRDLGVLTATAEIFFASYRQDLRPLAGTGVEIKASTGFVGTEASEWWGSSQAALSIAIWATTSDVHVYDARYNIPAHSLVDPAQPWPIEAGSPPVLIHYHYLAEPQYGEHLLEVMRRLGTASDVVRWVERELRHFADHEPSVCWCTMAIHEPYRRRARVLCQDAPEVPWLVLTDQPADFADLPIRAVGHVPTGPMAPEYLERLGPTGDNRGAAAYHDKRFALLGALEAHQTAIFLDADSRIDALPAMPRFPPGIAVLPVVRVTIAAHLARAGAWRLPSFIALAEQLTGSADILDSARWCHESCIAITKDGREGTFFDTWGRCADFLQARGVFSGEGGVLGLAAAIAGWSVDYDTIVAIGAAVRHEGGGPKVG